MHELSIANSLVDIVLEQLQNTPQAKVHSLHLKIGALSCVHRDSLQFSFEMITADTPLQGAALVIDELPVVVFCPECKELRELPGIQLFACPICGTRTADIRQGKELEIDSIELSCEE